MRGLKRAFAGLVLFGVFLLCAIFLLFFLNHKKTAFPENSGDAWTGHYEFSEYIPLNDGDREFAWRYSIRVLEKPANRRTADIVIDGFLTRKRYKARVVGDENDVFFVFEEYLPGNVPMFESFEKGDLLLRFVKNGEDIRAVWHGIRPNVESKGPVRFERIQGDREARRTEKEEPAAAQFEARPEDEIKIAEKRFETQTVRFLKALRKNSAVELSPLVLDDSFFISRIFTLPEQARGEEVVSQKIDLKDISSLDFPIGEKSELSNLNSCFSRSEIDSVYVSPLIATSADAFPSTPESGEEIVKQCDSVIDGIRSGFSGDVIVRVGESGFVFATLGGYRLTFSNWAYFEKAGDSFYLKSVFLFY
jgi:hypothetical protein